MWDYYYLLIGDSYPLVLLPLGCLQLSLLRVQLSWSASAFLSLAFWRACAASIFLLLPARLRVLSPSRPGAHWRPSAKSRHSWAVPGSPPYGPFSSSPPTISAILDLHSYSGWNEDFARRGLGLLGWLYHPLLIPCKFWHAFTGSSFCQCPDNPDFLKT